MQSKRLFGYLLISLLVSLSLSLSQYEVIDSQINKTTVILSLKYTGKDDYYIKPTSQIVKQLTFIFNMHTYGDFYFKIVNTNKKRFQIPQGGVFPSDPYKTFTFPIQQSAVTFTYTEKPFDFKIVRKQNQATIFSTYDNNIIFSNYYIEIGTQISSSYIFGLGERLAQGFRVQDGRWTMFNRDRGESVDSGIGFQTYGYFPFYFLRQKNNYFHVNYFRSSNALDVIKYTIQEKHYLTYKVIGGVVDFRFMLGEQDPQETIQKLHVYNQKSAIPPFWSLGYHQSRWGYKDFTALQNVISNFNKNDIPLDTLWSDLDYMINSQVFTIDETKFPLDKMRLLLQNYKWIPIIDPGIKNQGYFYQQGLKRNVYILDANTKLPMVGKMRVGNTVYVDFFHPNATNYWSDMLNILYQQVPFSAVWMDSNQFTSFCDGRCNPPATPSIFDYNQDIPYTPGMDDLEGDTISLNSTHYGNLLQADVHVYNGYLSVYSTYKFLESKNIKPFILTRSSVLGSSQYSIHWTGDNSASWQFLRTSIADNFNNQLWGFQMIGADICGFADNATEELCARWYQLGSFYTFCRNHNQRSSRDQQPYALGPIVLKAAVTNLKLRYSLLKYFYTVILENKQVGTIWKPLYFVFPLDNNLYLDQIMDTQFMFGKSLLITPILQQGQTSRKVYFPECNWYDLHTGKLYKPGTALIQNVQLTDKIPIFAKQNSIIFIQDTNGVTQTKQLNADNSFTLVIVFTYSQATSNATTKKYLSSGTMTSIMNYSDDEKIKKCMRMGCQYSFNFKLYETSSEKNLYLQVIYYGAIEFNELMIINRLKIYYKDKVIQFNPQKPIQINGSLKIQIALPNQLSTI